MIELENGGIIKSIHGDLYKNSIWYSIYGSKGRMETAREDFDEDSIKRIFVNADDYSGQYGENKVLDYKPVREQDGDAEEFGHGNSDFYSMYNFVRKIQGYKDADIIDVYEAMDMFLPGMFAYRSVLKGGVPIEIPNIRDKSVRELYKNDTMCTDPKVAGEQLLPVYSKGNPEISPVIYNAVREKWLSKNKEN